MSDKQQFNIYLPEDVVKAIKHAAIDSGDRLGEFVERVFREYLQKHNEEGEGK